MNTDATQNPSRSPWWLNGLDHVDRITLFIARIIAGRTYKGQLALITIPEAGRAALVSATRWSHRHLAYAHVYELLVHSRRPLVLKDILPLVRSAA